MSVGFWLIMDEYMLVEIEHHGCICLEEGLLRNL
jgi:hypothetical protein